MDDFILDQITRLRQLYLAKWGSQSRNMGRRQKNQVDTVRTETNGSINQQERCISKGVLFSPSEN